MIDLVNYKVFDDIWNWQYENGLSINDSLSDEDFRRSTSLVRINDVRTVKRTKG